MHAAEVDLPRGHLGAPLQQATQLHRRLRRPAELTLEHVLLGHAVIRQRDGEDGDRLAGRLQGAQQAALGAQELPAAAALALDEELEDLVVGHHVVDLARQLLILSAQPALDVERVGLLKELAEDRDAAELVARGDVRDRHAEVRPREAQVAAQHEVHVAAVARDEHHERVVRRGGPRGLEARAVERDLVRAAPQRFGQRQREGADRPVALRLRRGPDRVRQRLRPAPTRDRHLPLVLAHQVAVGAAAAQADVLRVVELGVVQRHRRAEVEGARGEVGERLVEELDLLVDAPQPAGQPTLAARRQRRLGRQRGRDVAGELVGLVATPRRADVGHAGSTVDRVLAEELRDDLRRLIDTAGVAQPSDGVADERRVEAGRRRHLERAAQDAVDDDVTGHDVELGRRVGDERAQAAGADEPDETGERRVAVEPAGEGLAPRRRDDRRPHDGQRQPLEAPRDQMLVDALGQRVGVRVAGLAHHRLLVRLAAQDGRVGLLGVEGQLRELLEHRPRTPTVRGHIRRRHHRAGLQLLAALGDGQHLHRRRDVRGGGLGDGQVEVDRRRAVDDVRRVTQHAGQIQVAQPAVRLRQLAADHAHTVPPILGQVIEAERAGDLVVEALARGQATLGADEHVDLLDVQLALLAHQRLEADLADKPGHARQEDGVATRAGAAASGRGGARAESMGRGRHGESSTRSPRARRDATPLGARST